MRFISGPLLYAGLVLVLPLSLAGQSPAPKPGTSPSKPAAAPATAAKPATVAPKASGAKLPPAIEAAFKAAYPNATIKHVSKEKEAGKDTYEVESLDRGLARDLVYRPDGTVMSMEEALTPEEVPAPVIAALKKRYPTAIITRRERLTEGTTVRYEIQLKGAKVGEAVLNADGTFVSPK